MLEHVSAYFLFGRIHTTRSKGTVSEYTIYAHICTCKIASLSTAIWFLTSLTAVRTRKHHARTGSSCATLTMGGLAKLRFQKGSASINHAIRPFSSKFRTGHRLIIGRIPGPIFPDQRHKWQVTEASPTQRFNSLSGQFLCPINKPV
jgi:hypothetical protein